MKTIIAIGVLILFYISQTYTKVDLSSFQLETIRVEIKGEVTKPGVYELPKHATLEDLLQEASGAKETANLDAFNLTMPLLHQSVIVIGKKQEKKCISINQADQKALMELNGVGEATAQRIIEYRMVQPFQTIEDVMKIKGIKEKLFSKIKDEICL